MKTKDYSTSFTVDKSPEEVFDAINNVREWWSQEIEGITGQLGAEFKYHYRDVHRCTFKITEFVPSRRVVWHVLDNYFNFVTDKSEWKGTDVVFEITKKGDETELRFTHVGLVPAYECYGVCSDAWGSYVNRSLRDLISTGKGQPNPIEEIVIEAGELDARRKASKDGEMTDQNYATHFTVDQSPEKVFAAINNVRGWWSGEIEGDTDKLGAEFTYRYKDVHRSKQKITEFIPGKRVVWHVLDSDLSFINDRSEWNDTDIVFDISEKGGRTEIRFTHAGLIPQFECYDSCSNGWGMLINRNLFKLITTGKGQPDAFA